MAQPPGDLPIPGGGDDPFADTPLFRELQRVLFSSTGPVNWELARQIAIASASWGEEDPEPTAEDHRILEETVRTAELAVTDLTGLSSPQLATIQAVRRAGWVESNIQGLREVLDPVAAKLAATMEEAQRATEVEPPPGMEGMAFLQQLMGQMAPLLLGWQFGTALGGLGQRVLGQYDLAIPRPTGELLFVVPNVARFERDWSLDPREFRAFVSVHEVAHRLEFARPWVRPHFLGLVRDLIEHAEIDLSGLEQRMQGVDLGDPEAMRSAMGEAGTLFGESSDPEQRLRIARVQAFVAVAEGFADHVMDTVGRRLLPSLGRIEEALVRYREGRPADEALESLLGLPMSEERYAQGRAFCERVVADTDEATLASMWASAEALPSMPEVEEPTLWLARTV
jgi:putative hydrolase